jgi:hypothetical protein
VARGRQAYLGVEERAEGAASHAKTLCAPREHARARPHRHVANGPRTRRGRAAHAAAQAEATPGWGRAAQGPRRARAGVGPRHHAMATPGPNRAHRAGQEAALRRGRGGLGEAAPGRGATAAPRTRRGRQGGAAQGGGERAMAGLRPRWGRATAEEGRWGHAGVGRDAGAAAVQDRDEPPRGEGRGSVRRAGRGGGPRRGRAGCWG